MSILKYLSHIAREINTTNIRWCVGGSFVLYVHNIIDSPNDIDILVDQEDASALDQMMRGMGEKRPTAHKDLYRTTHFYEYHINTVDIDVMGGFAINQNEGTYKFPFDSDSIGSYETIHGVSTPFSTLEDWYVLYQLIPGRFEKLFLIESYFETNGIQHPYLLERALDQPLPLDVRGRIEQLL